jgi:hypothetical protein
VPLRVIGSAGLGLQEDQPGRALGLSVNPANALAFQPPVLDANYMTWVPVAGSFGGQTLTAGGLDVLVKMPASAVPNSPGNYPSIRINGAKNVIIQGGRCSTPTSVGSEFNRDALIFSACTGVLHVEGMQLGLASEWCMNGIEVYGSPLATLQVQNCEMVMRSSDPVNFTDGHPDGIFTDNVGGTPAGNVLGALKISNCRFDTDYQGLSLFGNSCSAYVQRLHVRIVERGQAASTQGIWQQDNTDVITFGPQVYLTKRASQSYGLSVHPDTTDANTLRRPTVSATDITWPTEPTLIGAVLQGDPPLDFVPTDRGIGYTPRAAVRHY